MASMLPTVLGAGVAGSELFSWLRTLQGSQLLRSITPGGKKGEPSWTMSA